MDTAGLRVQTKQLWIYPLLMSVMSQNLANDQHVPQLQTASAELQTFLPNTLPPLRIFFTLFNLEY